MRELGNLLAQLNLFVAVPLLWFTVLVLWRLSHSSDWRENLVLRGQARSGVDLAVIVTVFVIVFLSNDQAVPPMDIETTRVLTRGTMFLASMDFTIRLLRLYWPWPRHRS